MVFSLLRAVLTSPVTLLRRIAKRLGHGRTDSTELPAGQGLKERSKQSTVCSACGGAAGRAAAQRQEMSSNQPENSASTSQHEHHNGIIDDFAQARRGWIEQAKSQVRQQ